MNYSKIVIIVLAFFLLGMGWYLLSEDSAPNKPQSASVYSDSISAPERPTFTAQEDTIEEDTAEEHTAPSPVGEDLAPGTALVKAIVISADLDREVNKELTIKTDEILGYGSATSPIAAQQELEIRVERFLKKNPDYEKFMQKGKTITIVISSEKGMSVGESQAKERWSLVELKSQ